MNNRVITIAREYGSGGRTIGKMLAKKLGWDYYDRELLRLASDESGINEDLFIKADEKTRGSLLFSTAKACYNGEVIPPDSDGFVSNENLFRYQAKIIRKLAETENCVIIGRGGNFVLQDYPNAVNVYIHASYENCVRKVMELFGLSRDEAEKIVKDTDKRRNEYYRYFTSHDWKDPDYYDLIINSASMPWERVVDEIISYMDIKLKAL